MRLVSTKSIKTDKVIAQTIYNTNGFALIRKGTSLNQKMIQRLIKQRITYVYIEDKLTDDLEVEPVIPSNLRMEAINTIKETFTELKSIGNTGKSYISDNKSEKLATITQQIIQEIQSNKKAISLLSDIYLTDDYIFQHSLNVTIYSLAIGSRMKLSNKELSEIGIGAILHDTGKIFIDQEVLKKPGKLSNKEFEIMKSHTQLGFDFLRKHNTLSSVVAHCAYQHHERIDGSGYPRGLFGKDMHPYAKIIAIADVFDATTSNRVYRDAMLPHEGLEILYAGAVNQFDKEMVEAFKKSVVVYPNGLTVQLSDGRTGVVSGQNKSLCDRPIIRIIKEKNKQQILPYELDMAQVVNVTITSCFAE